MANTGYEALAEGESHFAGEQLEMLGWSPNWGALYDCAMLHVRLDEGFPVVYASEGYHKLIASEAKEDLTGKSALAQVHSLDRMRLDCELREQLAVGDQCQAEHRIVRNDGSLAWAQLRGQVVRTGKVPLLCCVLIDNTASKQAREELKKKQLDFQMLTESIPSGVKRCQNDANFTISYVSDGFLDLFGYTMDDIHLLFGDGYLWMIHPDDRNPVRGEVARQLALGDTIHLTYRGLARGGKTVWILNNGRLVRTSDGQEYFHCVLVDVTESHLAQENLRMSEERYRIICEQSKDMIFEYNFRTQMLLCSESLVRKFGSVPQKPIEPEHLWKSAFIYPDDCQEVQSMYKRLGKDLTTAKAELRLRDAEGCYGWCAMSLTILHDEEQQPYKAIGKLTDVDSQRQEREQLIAKAERDLLTGLYNKGTAEAKAERCLETGMGLHHAMFIIDIDDFKSVNDQLGHLFGDAVLGEIGARIRELFRASDIVGRIGGDEFMVFLRDIRSDELVLKKAHALTEVFRKTFAGTTMSYKISGSIGIACYPQDGTTFKELFRNADHALYRAKRAGKDRFCLFDETEERHDPTSPADDFTALGGEETDASNPKLFHENITEYIFRIFYQTKDIYAAVDLILGLTGRYFNVSRAYVFENNEDNTACSNTFEWCNDGVESQKARLQNLSYNDLIGLEKLFLPDGVFYCADVQTLPPELRNVLQRKEITSVLQVAILDNGMFRGYVGFDQCGKKMFPMQRAVDTLNVISQILSTFLLKKHAQEHLLRSHRITQSVLDHMDLWTYVIDRDTHKLLFINRKTEELIPGTRVGNLCYRAFYNRTEPCEQCPMRALTEDNTECTMLLDNSYLKIWTKATASLMEWANHEDTVCLMSCTDVTDLFNGELHPHPFQ